MHLGATVGGGGGRGFFGCRGPLRPKRRGGVGIGGRGEVMLEGAVVGEGGQPLRTTLYTIRISLQNSL